ncbi:cobalamin biosynthesis protein CobG [Roseivivax sp. CAU 1761]
MSGPAQSRVRGWCPGAFRPMRSGDGLILRVRPDLARLTAAQARGLCDLAERLGSGMVQATNRGNLQLRGLAEPDHGAALDGLDALGLLPLDAAAEARPGLMLAPDWRAGDVTHRLARALAAALPDLPELPAKLGIAVDCGPAPVLADDPADLRLERGAAGGLILRAEGAARGRPVDESEVAAALAEMLGWFDRRRDGDARRMRGVVARHALPPGWTAEPPAAPRPRPAPGPAPGGLWCALPFGMVAAGELRAALDGRDGEIRVSPWRMLRLDGVRGTDAPGLIVRPGDPRLTIDACPGAPFCASAEIATRPLAEALAARGCADLHVSGCAKGCARPRPAARTLVGRGGLVDLVRDGCAWDEPAATGLDPDALSRMTL